MPSKNSKIVTEGDPLAHVMAPPPNETEEQREARLAAEAEAKRISDAIDEELQRPAKAETRGPKPVKILLLGAFPSLHITRCAAAAVKTQTLILLRSMQGRVNLVRHSSDSLPSPAITHVDLCTRQINHSEE